MYNEWLPLGDRLMTVFFPLLLTFSYLFDLILVSGSCIAFIKILGLMELMIFFIYHLFNIFEFQFRAYYSVSICYAKWLAGGPHKYSTQPGNVTKYRYPNGRAEVNWFLFSKHLVSKMYLVEY